MYLCICGQVKTYQNLLETRLSALTLCTCGTEPCSVSSASSSCIVVKVTFLILIENLIAAELYFSKFCSDLGLAQNFMVLLNLSLVSGGVESPCPIASAESSSELDSLYQI